MDASLLCWFQFLNSTMNSHPTNDRKVQPPAVQVSSLLGSTHECSTLGLAVVPWTARGARGEGEGRQWTVAFRAETTGWAPLYSCSALPSSPGDTPICAVTWVGQPRLSWAANYFGNYCTSPGPPADVERGSSSLALPLLLIKTPSYHASIITSTGLIQPEYGRGRCNHSLD
jgi:hypothetical protein